jgi:hypothetical protein
MSIARTTPAQNPLGLAKITRRCVNPADMRVIYHGFAEPVTFELS